MNILTARHAQTQVEPETQTSQNDGSRLVIVGSTSPPKLESTHQAFSAVWPGIAWEVEGVDAPSSVRDQPLSTEETIRGARNRALFAISDPRKPDYAVGIEGGLFRADGGWMECGWVVILDKNGNEGKGSSPAIAIPEHFALEMHAGRTLGEVCDDAFGVKDIGLREGYFGLMTKNAITRTSGYLPGIIFALARFVHPELFDRNAGS